MKRYRRILTIVFVFVLSLWLLATVYFNDDLSNYLAADCRQKFAKRGPHQKVVSFSFFGPVFEKDGGRNWFARVSPDIDEPLGFLYFPHSTLRLTVDIGYSGYRCCFGQRPGIDIPLPAVFRMH